jgi:hypothetical protein
VEVVAVVPGDGINSSITNSSNSNISSLGRTFQVHVLYGLNLPDITSQISAIAMFVTDHLRTIFYNSFVGMFTFVLHNVLI